MIFQACSRVPPKILGNPAVHHAGQVNMLEVAQMKLAADNGDDAADEGEQLEMLEEGEEEAPEADPHQD